MYITIYVCMYVYTIYVCTYIYIDVYYTFSLWVRITFHIWWYCMYVHMYVCMYICTYVDMYDVFMYGVLCMVYGLFVHVCMYICITQKDITYWIHTTTRVWGIILIIYPQWYNIHTLRTSYEVHSIVISMYDVFIMYVYVHIQSVYIAWTF